MAKEKKKKKREGCVDGEGSGSLELEEECGEDCPESDCDDWCRKRAEHSGDHKCRDGHKYPQE